MSTTGEKTVTVETWVGQFFGTVMELWRLNLQAEVALRSALGGLKVREAEGGPAVTPALGALAVVGALRPVVEVMERHFDNARLLLRTFGRTLPKVRALDTALTLASAELLVTNRSATLRFYDAMVGMDAEQLAGMAGDDAWAAPATLAPLEYPLEAEREALEREALGEASPAPEADAKPN